MYTNMYLHTISVFCQIVGLIYNMLAIQANYYHWHVSNPIFFSGPSFFPLGILAPVDSLTWLVYAQQREYLNWHIERRWDPYLLLYMYLFLADCYCTRVILCSLLSKARLLVRLLLSKVGTDVKVRLVDE
jgi:hypothetical protein